MLIEEGFPVQPIKFSVQSKANVFSNLKIFFEKRVDNKPAIRIPREKKLIDQLTMFEYEYTERNIMLHAPEGYHDDECDALALMVYGLSRINKPNVSVKII